MPSVTREEIFAQAARRLRQEFRELSTVPHNQLKGGEAERLVRRFLDEHMPKRFAAGAGFIIDPRNAVSPQQDVVVYDAHNCPVYRASDEAAIFPSNNVAAVVEVKSVLDKERLLSALDNIRAVKSLAKVRTPEIGRPVMDQTFGCVLAFESSITLETISEHYRYWLSGKSLGNHIDLIAVLDKGIVAIAASVPGFPGWGLAFLEGLGGDAGEGAHIGLSVQHLGESTLDVWFRLLLASITMFRGVVDHPGFAWSGSLPEGKQQITYITSVTTEKDPEKRKAILEKYAAQVKADFAKNPVPPVWPPKRSDA